MDTRTKERVERWNSRPFSGGYDELGRLSDAEFSGAVEAGGTWLFVLNGRVVGVVDGDIRAFDDATGTVYDAPDPSLPLLCSMWERGGETRAKYYTNETPLSEVDGTLREGSFTGYVELSENVLSGDYYAVYYGGRRMAAAFIGNAERLLTGDEAFDRADDEVGIYEVVDVDVEVTDVPGAATSDAEPDPESDPESAGRTESDADPGSGPRTGSNAAVDPDATSGDPVAGADDATAADGTDGATGAGNDGMADAGKDGMADAGNPGPAESRAESNRSAEPAPAVDTDRSSTDVTDAESGERSGITTSDDDAAEPASPGITDESPGPDDEDAVDASAVESAGREAGDRDDPAGERNPAPADVDAAADELGEEGDWLEYDGDPDAPTDGSSGRPSDADTASPSGATGENPTGSGAGTTDAASPDDQAELDDRLRQEAQWRETRSIPSIDPDNSDPGDPEGPGADVRRDDRTGEVASGGSRAASTEESRPDPAGGSRSERAGGSSAHGTAESNVGDAGSGRTERSVDAERSADAGSMSRADAGPKSAADGARTGGARSGSADRESGDRVPDRSGSANGGSAVGADGEPLERDMLEREDEIDRLQQRVDELEERETVLETERDELAEERDGLESTNRELSATVDRLRERIEELESALERARSATEGGSTAAASGDGQQLSPREALAGTNLFVRYESKSQATLETGHDGEADRSQVASNLRLEHHTGFDDGAATVGGQPYHEFLTSSMEYRFVDWLTSTLPFEIRDTGRANGLSELYDAIPRIDRAELHATVDVDVDADDAPQEVRFDVVAFDKRGDPLVVANLNDSREPATQGMLETLEADASVVAASSGELGAAFVVTSSFFEPGALEVADDATAGGFLSRDSKRSYVKLSRKQGYHLCLVESRSGGFHVNVPEL